MNKTTELQTTTAIVKNILEQDKRSRNSDDHLYSQVVKHISNQFYMPFFEMSVAEYFEQRNELPCPGFETVRRARQKLQEKYPELSASDKVEGFRSDNETVFREFARS